MVASEIKGIPGMAIQRCSKQSRDRVCVNGWSMCVSKLQADRDFGRRNADDSVRVWRAARRFVSALFGVSDVIVPRQALAVVGVGQGSRNDRSSGQWSRIASPGALRT